MELSREVVDPAVRPSVISYHPPPPHGTYSPAVCSKPCELETSYVAIKL